MANMQRILIIITMLLFAAIGIVLRLHNASVWNPYWGYDGGAHLKYVGIIASEHRLPTLDETYIAWHEPLFYILAAPFLKTELSGEEAWQALPYLSAILGITTFLLAGFWVWKKCKRLTAAALYFILLSGLPVAVAASTFFSNEGLAQLLLFGAIASLSVSTNPEKRKTAVIIGIILGLALLSKLTALLALTAIITWYAWRSIAIRNLKPLKNGASVFLITLVLASPWLVYRLQTYQGFFNNPYEAGFVQERLPNNFFTSIDRNIYFSPFWPAGSNSFWSVVYAGLITDYDARLHNPDLTPGPRVLVGTNRTVSKQHAYLAQTAVILGTALVPLFLLACWRLVVRVWQKRKTPGADALIFLYLLLSLIALVANIALHRSLERGNLKPIFVLSAIFILFALVAETVTDPGQQKRQRLALTAYTFIVGITYSFTALLLCWV